MKKTMNIKSSKDIYKQSVSSMIKTIDSRYNYWYECQWKHWSFVLFDSILIWAKLLVIEY